MALLLLATLGEDVVLGGKNNAVISIPFPILV